MRDETKIGVPTLRLVREQPKEDAVKKDAVKKDAVKDLTRAARRLGFELVCSRPDDTYGLAAIDKRRHVIGFVDIFSPGDITTGREKYDAFTFKLCHLSICGTLAEVQAWITAHVERTHLDEEPRDDVED